MRARRLIVGTTTSVAVLMLPLAASAHVTVHPDAVPAGAEFTRIDLSVPNEREDSDTTKVDVKLPDGFPEVWVEAKPGWNVKRSTKKLSKPITVEGAKLTQEVSRITWSGDGERGKIAPREFADFRLSLLIPDTPGKTLTFKTIQTYDNGTVVRWIGPEGSEEEAAFLRVTSAQDESAGGAVGTADDEGNADDSDDDDGASKGLGIDALVIAILGLLAGGAALVRGRRS